jgi:hypothetical protein
MNRPTVKLEEVHDKEVPIKMGVWHKKCNKKHQKLKRVDRDKRVKAVNFVLAWRNLSLIQNSYGCHTANTSQKNTN